MSTHPSILVPYAIFETGFRQRDRELRSHTLGSLLYDHSHCVNAWHMNDIIRP